MDEFRHLKCAECDQKLRIRVGQENFGKMVIVKCPKCQTKMRVAIPVPADPETPEADSQGNEKCQPPFEDSDLFDLFNPFRPHKHR